MEETIEARWLINNWNTEVLGIYKSQWIAVLGERIIAHAETYRAISRIISEYQNSELNGQHVSPLFAFVHFGRLQ